MRTKLNDIISSVKKPDEVAMNEAKKRHSELAKPPGSLGRLEEISIQIAGITGKILNRIKNKHLLIFASDNGVVEEGVSSAPQYVTKAQVINMTKYKTGATVLCKHFGCSVSVCDVGIKSDVEGYGILKNKFTYGTNNIAKGKAMTYEQAIEMIVYGAETAKSINAHIIGVGEMGIGNTTTSAAVLSVLLDLDVEEVAGRGGGITNEAFERKKSVIKKSISVNKPDKNDVLDVISKVGGFDIAAMCGAYLGAAAAGRPVVIDGFISAVAALCAANLCPDCINYMFTSHCSVEPGYKHAIDALGLKPILNLDMRLGEGSGCPFAFEIIDASCAVLNDMATFEQADIDDAYLDEIRKM